MGSWYHGFDPLFLSEGCSTRTLSWAISLCWNKCITDCYDLWTAVIMQMVLFWNLLRNQVLSCKVFNDWIIQPLRSAQLWPHLAGFLFLSLLWLWLWDKWYHLLLPYILYWLSAFLFGIFFIWRMRRRALAACFWGWYLLHPKGYSVP